MKKLKTILFILFLFSPLSIQAKDDDLITLKLEINSRFKRNKKIWGTYNQYSESVNNKRRKGRKITLRDKNQDGDIVIQKGKFHLVRPVENNGRTKVVVASANYKRPRKGTYLLKDENLKLYEMYGPKIERFIKIHYPGHKKKIGPQTTNFGQLSCRNSKGKLDCKLPIEIKIPKKS